MLEPTIPIITTLAEYQTRFWVEIGLEMRRRGREARFLSFDSRSNEMLAAAGLDYVDATSSACEAALGDKDAFEVCQDFGVERLNFWLTHEKFAFGIRDSEALIRKLAGSLLVADKAIASMPKGSRLKMLQELGGFLSVIGSHFAALHHDIPSLLLEPSFFRGRLLFLSGDIQALKLEDSASEPASAEVLAYLEDTLARSAIVIPEKDRHQYTTAFRKVVNFRNARRLIQKLIDKHLLGKEQEFGHIGSHVSSHARMILASRKLSKLYTPISQLDSFVYYPLHVPGDMALTLRSPEYLDQEALIDYICRVTPPGVAIAVKEHPAMIGAMGAEPLEKLKRRYDHFHLIPPSTNNFDVLRRADAIVTVNSKSGAEAGLLGQRVIVLGDAFYRNAPFSLPVERMADLGPALASVLDGTAPAAPQLNVQDYFAALWNETLAGELYVCDHANIERFVDSIITSLD